MSERATSPVSPLATVRIALEHYAEAALVMGVYPPKKVTDALAVLDSLDGTITPEPRRSGARRETSSCRGVLDLLLPAAVEVQLCARPSGRADRRESMSQSRPLSERLMEKIRYTPTGCWEWTARRDKDGYGQILVGSRPTRKCRQAHRVAYELFVGPIPPGLTIDHLCRNRACINPDHMEPTDIWANTMRGICPSSVNARKSYCVHGHPFDEENTYFSKSGHRQCRACSRAKSARYAKRKKAAASK